ncbi:uncharacterized protein BDZ99DRAFT_525232 [Mytilinidion resinicola]|uniref:Uncharacterized protein n=1 Tax=Mytilinidion resinicola TaxID=574789 RepID=A0A6A6Y7S2_9PEZI|nr:uncharacterized protein BDZ99DRAFT_525232 [Mytilinidion resinicola]KAF2804891.1 hypothetical protein BDZ99DRAFT_525232 [Mytilinidion resinicola]
MEDKWQLIDLLTQARDLAIRSLEPNTIKDRKAVAMKLKQLAGEIEVSEAKVHRALVSGVETSFLSLPRERRDKIYATALISKNCICFNRMKWDDCGEIPDNHLSLLRTTRQVRLEAREIFYARNDFHLLGYSHIKAPLWKLHDMLRPVSDAFSSIQKLHLALTRKSHRVAVRGARNLAEFEYIDNFDPHHITKYARVCCTNEGQVLEEIYYLFTY